MGSTGTALAHSTDGPHSASDARPRAGRRRRPTRVATIALAGAATVLAVLISGPVGADAAPRSAQYCSESGDSCVNLHLRGSRVVAELALIERYVTSARVCVRPPGRAWLCRNRPVVRRSAGGWVARLAVAARPGTWASGYGTVPRGRPVTPVVRLVVPR